MNHDELDQQIRAALHVEPSPEQIARLECFWERQSRADRRRRMRPAMALAASILLAVTLSARLWLPAPTPQPTQTKQPATHASVPTAVEPSRPDAPPTWADQPSPHDALSAGRPPTAYERLFFAVRTGKPVASAQSTMGIATIDRLIQQLTQDPTASAEQLAVSAGLTPANAEMLLLRRLQRSNDDDQRAILQLLVVCGSPASTPALLELGRREAFREQALVTLERIVGVERLADAVAQTTDSHVRRALIRRLLTSGDDLALRGYLSLLHDEATRGEALAVADAVPQLPLTSLLALFEDEEKTVRLSAAMVLGHVNGPEVTKALISLVIQEPSGPTEAWIALLACRGELAEQFLAYATFRPQLLGRVNNARVQLARMIP